jgi:phasin family protein
MDDVFKFPIPIERMVAVLRYRGLDAEALILAQQHNIRSFVDAQESFVKGMEQLIETQGGMVRDTVSRATEVLPEMAKQRSIQGLAQAQLDYQRKAAEAAMENLQQIAQLMWTQQRNVMNIFTQSFNEGMDSLAKANGSEPEVANDSGKADDK